MVRVPWEREEQAVLLQALLLVRAGAIGRKDAIAEVSRMLRQYAQARGREIDEKFRNVAGITMQMSALEYVVTNGATTNLHSGAWREEIVRLQKEEPEEFRQILQKVSDVLEADDQRAADRQAALVAEERQGYETQTQKSEKLPMPQGETAAEHEETPCATGQEAKAGTGKEASSMRETADEGTRLRFDGTNFAAFAGTVPVDCQIVGQPLHGKNWSHLFAAVTDFCLAHRSERMQDLYRQPLPTSRNRRPFFMREKIPVLTCKEVANGCYINTYHNNAQSIIRQMAALCEHCGYPLEQVVLYGAQKNTKQTREKAFVARDLSEPPDRPAQVAAGAEVLPAKPQPPEVTEDTEARQLPRYQTAIEAAEQFLEGRGLAGAELQEILSVLEEKRKQTVLHLYNHGQIGSSAVFHQMTALSITQSALRQGLARSESVINLPRGRYVHAAAFVDLDEAEDTLRGILLRQFAQFDGYSNEGLLFGAARQELSLFLNDNDCEDAETVYALARFFFSQRQTPDKAFYFDAPHIFRKKPDYPATLCGLMIHQARQAGGVLTEEAGVAFLRRVGLTNYATLRQVLRIGRGRTFLLYDASRYLLSESLPPDEAFCQKMHAALDGLLREANVAYVVPRDIRETWLARLPRLPHGLPWTHLLLQETIAQFPAIGFRVIRANVNQTLDTIAAALVPQGSPLEGMADVVALYLREHHPDFVQKRLPREELRETLVKAGMVAGNELKYNLHKVLTGGRFAWSDGNETVCFLG